MRERLEARQLDRLNRLLRAIHEGRNAFQQRRVPARVDSLEAFRKLAPLTTKAELLADHQAAPPFGTNLTFPIEDYRRYCQTSGTSGEPMAWLDTAESWQALLDCWKEVYRHAGIEPGRDRVFFAFSFGPFLGFWTAFDAAAQLGYLCIPGGGMSSASRLRTMERVQATTLCCTPTYALRLGEQLQLEGRTISSIRRIIVAGEPGGSLPATRRRLENLWGKQMRVVDHHGLTEVGPVSYENPRHPGTLMVLEDAYLAEIIDPRTGAEVGEGEEGELVLTTLKRTASPLLRYRTGDLVRKCYDENQLGLKGGILGRLDDMVLVRGVNVYPAAIENVVRQFDAVSEFQVVQSSRDAMTELEVEVELIENADPEKTAARLSEALREHFQLRIPAKVLPTGSLPRYEFKAKRWVTRNAG